ncbi:MAG: hypothetical protein HY897_02295 [Deltaproteobacteria bacterium]|nr:hypothetical protein [Deltaproteobacteria bacterium]
MERVLRKAVVAVAAVIGAAVGAAWAAGGIAGCGAMGNDAPEVELASSRPPLSSFMPVFIQLARQGDLDDLSTVVRELERTGMLKDLVDALDLSIRAVGGDALKEVLEQVLVDPEFRAFFRKDGPFHQVLAYPKVYDVLDTLHVLSKSGVVHNGLIPLVGAVVESPLFRALVDADRAMIRSGAAAAALGAVRGLAAEKVDYVIEGPEGEPQTVAVPVLTPLLSMLVTLAEGEELTALAHSVIDLMIDERVAPLFAVAGELAGAIDADPGMARRIAANLGHGFLAVDRNQMTGLRAILDHMVINSVGVRAVDNSVVNVSIPGQLRALAGDDGEGGRRLVAILRNLGPEVVENTAPALAEPFARHCLDPKEGGDGLAHPDEDAADDKDSCFMQMLHMANSMYGKEILTAPDIRELGAELITANCSHHLLPEDPEWATAVETTTKGKQPLLPDFPKNVLKVFLENVGNRVRCLDAQGNPDDCGKYEVGQRRYSQEMSIAYSSYINCVLHGDVPAVYFSAGLDWEIDVVGFAALEYIARRGGLDFMFPVVYEMQRHPDGSDHIWDVSNLVAMLWGADGSELGRYWRVVLSFFNHPSPDMSLVADLTRLLDVLLDLEVQYGNDRRVAADILVETLVVLNTPDAEGNVPIVDSIAVPLLNIISRNIDADLEYAIPGLAAALTDPAYRAEGLFTLVAAALTEREGSVSYTDYIDSKSGHYLPTFSSEARGLVDAAIPRLETLARYLLRHDPEGVVAGVLAYAVDRGVAADLLTLFEHLMTYDSEHRLLDFVSRLLRGGAVTTTNDMLDVIHERGLEKTAIPIFELFCEKDVWPEFLDLLYQVLPLINLGKTQ